MRPGTQFVPAIDLWHTLVLKIGTDCSTFDKIVVLKKIENNSGIYILCILLG